MTIEDLLVICFLFLIISMIYSSVGFGGGSSYLAILALMNVAFIPMKTIALLCNILVVTGNLIVFRQNNLLGFKKSLPLILISIPASFFGGYYNLSSASFFLLLGFSLISAGILLLITLKRGISVSLPVKNKIAISSSAGIGILSGLVGIGGGIFLSPVLNLINWDSAKKIAATSSLFILINSISGISGHLLKTGLPEDTYRLWPLLLSVIIGGQIGSRITSYKFRHSHVKIITGCLVLLAGIKILSDHLPKAF